MSILSLALTNLAVALGMMVLFWLLSLALKDASIVDPFWGTGFVVLAWVTFFNVSEISSRSVLLLILVTVWGLRLSIYLLWRNVGKGEDRRYGAMRDKHGKNFWWVSLITVFVLQGLIMWFVSLTFQSGMHGSQDGGSLYWLDWIGIAIWSVGFFFEAVGDYQMARFKADPSNKCRVMDRGLWSLTRHPNYFGDFCIWWGIFVIASASGAWWTILSPILMSVLLLKVSGVSLLESDIEERRPGYREYKNKTNSFFPWPARS